jgi:diadenosine tetraphosphate (Ap4A) HIT family hydrolase
LKDPYAQWLLKEFTHWKVYLHGSQEYLGRCYLWAKRADLVDLMDCTDEEWEECRAVGRLVRLALYADPFRADMFNYAALGNEARHCHVHIIPRYERSRVFAGKEFIDWNWSKNYAPYNKERRFDPVILCAIRDALQKNLDGVD